MLYVLELYSGIGGMHYAVKELNIPFSVVGAMDINTNANAVYRHNFPGATLTSRNIEGLSAKELDSLNADILLMSPPCQPFTRLGKQGASSDARAKSFLCLLDTLKSMVNKPRYILMENVKGFECSDTRELFIECLDACGYMYQEFLLTPSQVGIPNARLRYYLLAVVERIGFSFEPKNRIMEDLPTHFDQSTSEDTTSALHSNESTNPSCSSKTLQDDDTQNCPGELFNYLQSDEQASWLNQFRVPLRTLRRFGTLLDIVYPDSTNSCCFTKGYSHYVEGTGSVISTSSREEVYSMFSRLDKEEVSDKELESLQLRYFTPREILRLLCFPDDFKFPEGITIKQQYKLLGNSLNVRVVAQLLRTCFFPNVTKSS